METNSTFEMCNFNLKILEKHEKTRDICDKVNLGSITTSFY